MTLFRSLAKAPRISARCTGRDNNFNLIRVCAAGAVLVSHAVPITLGGAAPEPLELWISKSLGTVAVAIFFCISGFLIARSFERSHSLADWAAARIMRLFPGLLVAVALCAFVLGPLVTTLPVSAYFAEPAAWSYVPRNVSLTSLQYPLPGVFEDAPYPHAVNGSLWTLVHEVACYLGVMVMGLLGALRGARAALAIAVWAVAYVALGDGLAGQIHPKLGPLRELSLPYMLGVVAWIWRARIPLDWRIALGLAIATALIALVLTTGAGLFTPALWLCVCYAVFCVAWLIKGRILRFNAFSDVSYGLYIYAFPVQQTTTWLLGPMTPTQNVAIALPVTLALAALSWRLVEKPGLDRRRALARMLAWAAELPRRRRS